MEKQVIPLNNDYNTNKRKAQEKLPRRKHLGIILIGAMLLFSLATISVAQAYQNLQKQVGIEKQAINQNTSLDDAIALKNSEIKKMQDPNFLAKYARAAYQYSQPNEKVFTAPSLVSGGITP